MSPVNGSVVHISNRIIKTFRYLGPVIAAAVSPDITTVPTSDSMVAYKWLLCYGQIVAEQQVELLCSNAKKKTQHIPLPRGWKTAFRALSLPMVAERSAAQANNKYGTGEITCQVLGIARSPPLLTFDGEERVGSLAMLFSEAGGKRAYVLCANIFDSQWLCHSGPADGAEDSPRMVFDASDLVSFDLGTDVRIDPSVEAFAQLSALAWKHPADFAQLVAESAWKAEERRAELQCRDICVDEASAQFEVNPFLWADISTAEITVSWSKRTVSGFAADAREYQLRACHLDDILKGAGRLFPAPEFLKMLPTLDDLEFRTECREAFEEYARHYTKELMWPIKYLGHLLGGNPSTGPYEPDPAKWPELAIKAARGFTNMDVWFEWQHVTVGPAKKPHRVSLKVKHIVRQLPQVEVDLHVPFKFQDANGDFELNGFEVLKAMKSRRIYGRAKFEAAKGLRLTLQDLFAQMTHDKKIRMVLRRRMTQWRCH